MEQIPISIKCYLEIIQSKLPQVLFLIKRLPPWEPWGEFLASTLWGGVSVQSLQAAL